MNLFKSAIESLPQFRELKTACDENTLPVLVTGVSAVHKAQIAFSLAEEQMLIITEDEAIASRFADDINQMAGDNICLVYPAKDYVFTDIEGASYEYEHRRLDVLSRLLSGKCRIVVASIEAVLQKTISKERLNESIVTLKQGDDIEIKELLSKLVSIGYSRADEKVEGAAQFSARGSIVDIFPVQSSMPVRIEFWGDTIDSISYFDVESQRRNEKIPEVSVSPAIEVVCDAETLISKIEEFSNGVKGKHAEDIKNKLSEDIDKLQNGVTLNSRDKYLVISDNPSTLFDYINGIVCISEIKNIIERAKVIVSQYNEDIKILLERYELCKGLEGYMLGLSEFTHILDDKKSVFLDTFARSSVDIHYKKIINITAFQNSGWGGELRQLTEDLSSYCKRGYSVILLAGNEKTIKILQNDLLDENIPCDIATEKSSLIPGKVMLMPGSTSGGYEYPDIKQALITQTQLSPSRRKLKKRKKGEEIKSLSDVSKGDLVVHNMYGIGSFDGITKLDVSGVEKDYIKIKYAGTDVLYVPVTQMDLISRYIGPREDTSVKLNKLSSPEWQKTRSRVKSAVKDMADELIALYAKRAATKGYAFPEDDDMQRDFDERFEYDETDDQLQSIDEIKKDMQKDTPMDRLLCGDVGFGKTEVAFRGVFKCVEDGKQCAILVPTTVLAWQHYQTALKRFEHFPINIELLSRFRTPKQQKEILKKLEKGEIDLIIGTHRLVQKDVKFKDLGLVVIDEEQRFGVAHKEKFKEMFAGVDVLTLSATPIPRTLNMAMSGIRDMSVIEEAPQDRYPVQTYVVEQDIGIIIQAISKELRRGGQVYYIHNRIETIELCAAKIKEFIPDARIGIAHGKIGEEELSDVWRSLVEHEIDILVCTTLIETGVDVPNCNTLIIEDADRMGLSQLYQLRGRVGRSNRRAFAYFMFTRGKVLTEIAAKRLDAIREFTQFGSGFRIALRDLEIRGAGSILGGKQHGHMEAVGYDMYLKLLSEAIAEQKGEPPPKDTKECRVDIQIEAHIPERYIENTSARLDAYRKIAAVSDETEANELVEEFTDRYGKPPKAIMGLIRIALLRNKAISLTITEIVQRGENILFYLTYAEEAQLKALLSRYKKRVLFNGREKNSYISVKIINDIKPIDLMEEVITIMRNADCEQNSK
ncbi:MAG: transcription-repair coupling factor [Oscillospiraceae bacterium]|nr:transcription-repair coupling factor [Oscillospiraceae bacterium]